MVGRLEGERDWDGRKAADPTPQPPLVRYTALKLNGGEGGIRTPDSLTTMPDFESGAFNRALPPLRNPKDLRMPGLFF